MLVQFAKVRTCKYRSITDGFLMLTCEVLKDHEGSAQIVKSQGIAIVYSLGLSESDVS